MNKKILLYGALGLVVLVLALFTIFPGMIYAVKDAGITGNSLSNSTNDKCSPAPGYDEESWREHMSHHPNIYKECFVSDLESDEFEEFVESDNVFIINTHTPYIGEIEGTDLIAKDWQNIASYEDQLPENKNAPIGVYCRSGSMSSSAASQLIDLGYTNVYNLEGGMNAWRDSGRTLI